MHAIRPYCNYSVISIANSSDFLVKLRKIKPMRGLCNSYQVYRIFFYVRFLCRKNVIDNVVPVETIFYLTLAYVTCYNFPKTPDFSRAETILNIPKRNSIISRLIASKADSTLITCKSTINSAPIVIDVHMGMLPSCLLCMINT